MGPGLGKVLVLGALVLLAVALWRWLDRGRGEAKAVTGEARITADDLGRPLGGAATFVQFSSPACAPCAAASRVLSQVAGEDAAVEHVEVDAVTRGDLARAHHVLRTPTTLLLDADGRVAGRIPGAPTFVQAREALAGLAAAHDRPMTDL